MLLFRAETGFHRNVSDLKFPIEILKKFLAFFDHSKKEKKGGKGDSLFYVQDKHRGSFQDSVFKSDERCCIFLEWKHTTQRTY